MSLAREVLSLVEKLEIKEAKVKGVLEFVQPNYILTVNGKSYMLGSGVNAMALGKELGLTNKDFQRAREEGRVEVQVDSSKLNELPEM